MRKCRVCLHTINDTCRICDHCGEDLIHGRRPTAIVVPPAPIAPPTPDAPARTCPFCAEEIQSAAIVCKHCRRDLPRIQTRSIQVIPQAPPAAQSSGAGLFKLFLKVLVVGALALVVVSMVIDGTSSTASAPPYSPTGASLICQQFVGDRLKAPASAKFPETSKDTVRDLGAGKFNVVSYVDAQNGFGALIRNRYDCSVHWVSGKEWMLDSLDMHGR